MSPQNSALAFNDHVGNSRASASTELGRGADAAARSKSAAESKPKFRPSQAQTDLMDSSLAGFHPDIERNITNKHWLVKNLDMDSGKVDELIAQYRSDLSGLGEDLARAKFAMSARAVVGQEWVKKGYMSTPVYSSRLDADQAEYNLLLSLKVFDAQVLKDYESRMHTNDGEIARLTQVNESRVGQLRDPNSELSKSGITEENDAVLRNNTLKINELQQANREFEGRIDQLKAQGFQASNGITDLGLTCNNLYQAITGLEDSIADLNSVLGNPNLSISVREEYKAMLTEAQGRFAHIKALHDLAFNMLMSQPESQRPPQ